ncbi:MAG: hypothetical protein ACK5LY_00630 [Lachnospirales bacterium]
MDGEIITSTDENERPTEDNQSNFGIGYGYQFFDEKHIDVFIDDEGAEKVKEEKNITNANGTKIVR